AEADALLRSALEHMGSEASAAQAAARAAAHRAAAAEGAAWRAEAESPASGAEASGLSAGVVTAAASVLQRAEAEADSLHSYLLASRWRRAGGGHHGEGAGQLFGESWSALVWPRAWRRARARRGRRGPRGPAVAPRCGCADLPAERSAWPVAVRRHPQTV
ncbi:unnamed protein product, partial [Prorocentrum cordatum]